MKFSLNANALRAWDGDVLIIGVLEDKSKSTFKLLEERYGDSITKNLTKQKFTGKSGQIATFHLLQQHSEEATFVVGLGETNSLTIESFRKATSLAVKQSKGTEGKIGVLFPWGNIDKAKEIQAVAEAVRLCLFKDERFKSKTDTQNTPSELEMIGVESIPEISLKNVSSTCAGVELARELVGAPPNQLSPEALATEATQLSKEFNLQLKILEQEECKKEGMGAYLAVAQGSDLKPKFIHLTYKGKGKINRKLAIVGKGLTFDSGGYNLKVGAAQIELMKFDMGGSAAVLGTARAIAEIAPSGVEVHFIIAACENMINGSAVHPGDIVTASNGKTIEINNTDAEGRLTLADALFYASKLKPHSIVDLATLTGACVIALGDEVAGLWSENDELANDLLAAATESGEGLWRMPMQNSYKDGLKSMLADLKNTGPRAGGSITAALFLKEFVEASTPWAHIDIAGTVWADKDKGINPAGATGYGVRTLLKWILINNGKDSTND
ncbi:leucyl aminopeptidase [Prochlorococcus sp. MIT 1341]|uniref:leucyl aminopeptidase n=1 Tax=Prochlorococcus sp. MIT 1341 TaxID=3096221 RepID=UPI002A74B583|nr:leucyl aminopeptidase [Prochlorococcus sp. MIT 1341]